jgi:hypothetical protein
MPGAGPDVAGRCDHRTEAGAVRPVEGVGRDHQRRMALGRVTGDERKRHGDDIPAPKGHDLEGNRSLMFGRQPRSGAISGPRGKADSAEFATL